MPLIHPCHCPATIFAYGQTGKNLKRSLPRSRLIDAFGRPFAHPFLDVLSFCSFIRLSGSGKTHSMLGEVEENSEKNGIIPRAVDHIFSFIRSQHADAPIDDEEAALNAKIVSNTLGEVQFLISLSFLEIYKSDTQTHRPGRAHLTPVHVFRRPRLRVSACERLWATLFSPVHLLSVRAPL